MAENSNDNVEEWESTVKGGRTVGRWSEKGELTSERVEGGATFYVTPDERRRNETLPRDQRDNPFTNGTFRMLRAAADDKDSASRFKTVKAKTDDELLKLLDSTWTTFQREFAKIKEAVTVERLYTLARANEVGGNKMKVIMDELRKLRPQTVLVGDSVAAGNEQAPDGQGYRGPAANIDNEIEGDSGPRQYANTGI